MRPTTTDPRSAPLRVLVPYILTHGGGVRTVLRAGLPPLAALPDVRVTYAELCRNDEDMDELERRGVAVDRGAGIPGPAALSRRTGWRRSVDVAGQAGRLLALARRLAPRLRAHDVCWVHGHRELLLAIAARALAGAASTPIVWHWHGPPLSVSAGARGSWAGRRVARLGARRCARVIAISGFCAGQAARMGVDPGRVVTVLNAAAVSPPAGEGPPLPPRAAGAFVSLLACASIRPHKGVHLAVEALAELPASHVLWVTGDRADPLAAGYVAALERTAARLGVSDRVRLLGRRPDVHRVMAAADAVVVPSVWEEPFGLVAAEAQLAGVPVVVSRRGALPEIAADGALGVVFDAGEPRALAAALQRLAADPPARAAMAERARAAARRRYAYERWCREVADVLREAAGRGAAAGPARGRAERAAGDG
jgi:glycosyltransferase involved in cell wall biosynthesis